ncbi:MAG: DUF3488 and transglutaminase-like domain-containing protein [Pseudomonadota bacterium]|nr:DUF3488 and transglutaminase-like domain-containing protein [Pseudomonadota bacterium]
MAERPALSLALDAGSRRWALGAGAACLLPLLLQLPQALASMIAATAVLVAWLSWRRQLPPLLRLMLALGLIGAVLLQAGNAYGRETGCALLAAMLAIKPAETLGLRDARSLVGFALFAPFAAFLLDQGPGTMLLGVIAAVVALAALQRLADLESGDPAVAGAMPRFAAVARLIAIGLPLALAVFWLFPRLVSPLWGVPERGQATPGLSDSMTPGEWLDLLNDDTPALRARFFGRAPETSQMYWRGPVLWNFDGRTWSQSYWLRGLPAAPVLNSPTVWEYELQIEPTERRQLVALDLLLAAPEGTVISRDHGLHVPRRLGSISRWRMQSSPPTVHEPQLPTTLRSAALALPEGFNPRSRALSRQWRRDAGSDDAAIVKRAMDWVRAEFIYTLDTPLPGRHAVDEFLFEQKRGFCEHYSSAFVVLMRGAGIPARVVTGYVGGRLNTLGDYWLVRRSDAHAWAEVWLPARGWVRVDPTAAIAPERIYDTLADRAPATGFLDEVLTSAFGTMAGWHDARDLLRRGWNDLVVGFDARRQASLLRPLGLGELGARQLAVLFSLCAALALLWMIWLSSRGQRLKDPVLRAWHALDRRYRRVGLGRQPHEAAVPWALRVAAAGWESRNAALLSLTRRFSDWRYAPDVPGRERADQSRQLVRDLRAHRLPSNGERR